MPYIKKTQREYLNQGAPPMNSGELNYLITRLIVWYIRVRGGLRYEIINDILGALDGARAEFYDRVARPYENQKIKENGDVYPPEYTMEKDGNGNV